MRRIPRLDKRLLRLIRILLGADFLDTHARPVLGENDILLLHLLDAALGQLVGVEKDLISNPAHPPNNSEENHQREKIRDTHIARCNWNL